MKKVILFLLMFLIWNCQSNQSDNKSEITFKYEPEKIRLHGLLKKEVALNSSTKYYYIELTNPINVMAYPNDELNETISGIDKIQIANINKIDIKSFLDKNVICEGTLYMAHTAHHYTRVLITLEKIK